MGSDGLRFSMTQFCLHVAWTVSEERRRTGEETDGRHKRLGEEKGSLGGLEFSRV